MKKITRLTFVVFALVCSSIGSAQEENSQSFSIRAGASNTDNVFLTSDPTQDETIYQVSPSIQASYVRQRFSASINYQFDWYRYADLKTSDQFHQYDLSLNSQLVDEIFEVSLGATRNQSIIDPNGPIQVGNRARSENLADQDNYFVNPRLELPVGQIGLFSVDYRYTIVRVDADTDNPLVLEDNSDNQNTTVSLSSDSSNEGITWELQYRRDETDYDTALPWEFNRATVEIGFWVNNSLRVFGSGGQESAWDDPVDRGLEDEFWEAGFEFRGGDRLNMEVAAGERSFGSSWRASLDSSFRRGTLSVSYAETPTSTSLNRFTRNNLTDPNGNIDLLTRPGSAERYVSERGEARLEFDFRRLTLGASVYDEQRIGRFRADGTPIPDESQMGYSIFTTVTLGPRTSVSASGGISSIENDVREQDFVTASLSAEYRLGNRISVTAFYQYAEQDPESSISPGIDYVSNTTGLFFNYTF